MRWLMSRPRLVLSIILLLLAFGFWYRLSESPKPKELTVDELYRALDAGEVEELNIDATSGVVAGKLKNKESFQSQVANRDLL